MGNVKNDTTQETLLALGLLAGTGILLPASDGRISDQVYYRVGGGEDWSGMLSSERGEACQMYFNQGPQRIEDICRHYGYPVRSITN
jgi:hypothetical protein